MSTEQSDDGVEREGAADGEDEETYISDPDSIPADRNDAEDLGFGGTEL